MPNRIEKANRLLRAMAAVPKPPGYAKALSEAYHEMQAFLRRFKPGDPEQRDRFLARMSDIEFLVGDMQKANVEASNPQKKPVVFIPSGLWASILGEDHETPQDGEHWPLARPDGPMTWKK